ncbi:hypothetical protein DEA8626_02840 [Defluviimonas aquaemixtae]|uniref:GHMP kinase N-terminal domain-containing protein n=1 Tax=Albidovulum aquaemixtae TaxID=1542388 RepID=A0A2R8BK42_9RHOB|nr:propanediol utilization protein [Defluviimonas aquaemixtae]SPH23771.1 hypothetical protein DEA8626_02840 [Defluviimonas aquaemixtae]
MTAAAIRVAGHFGELLQGRIGRDGPVALVTLPCPALSLGGWHLPGPGLAVHGGGQRLITPERARRFLGSLGLTLGGRVVLRACMPAGGGGGASTAALLALAGLAGYRGAPEDLAHACIEAEGASDPLMFDRPERLLWASRRGRVLEALPPVPRFDVIGGFYGPDRRTEAGDASFPDISDLLADWRGATRAGDATAAAAVASVSARRTLAMRGPSDDPTERLAGDLGALGFAIAHTGSARALLFAPGRIAPDAPAALRRAGIRAVLRFSVGKERP